MKQAMFFTPTNPAMFDTSFLEGQKMEYVMADDKLKNNLWKKIAPVNTLLNKHKVNFEQVKSLVLDFFSELLQKNQRFSNVNPAELVAYFIKGSKNLLEYNPEKISVELTSARSIYFFAKVGSNNVYYEMFFDDATGKFATTAVNIYENKSQKLAISGSLKKVADELEEHLTDNSADNYITYILVPNEVSGSAVAQFAM